MWTNSTASAQGLAYAHEGRNNQDAASHWTDGKYSISFINDGCHAGSFSEVGARLSNNFLIRKTRELIAQKKSLDDIAVLLFPMYIEYLELQVKSQLFCYPQEIADYISSYLYCTALGIIATPDQVMFLSCGDGSFYLNDNVYETIVSPDQKATYPGYCLYTRFGFDPGDGIRALTPSGFKRTVFDASYVQSAAITSDGLNGRDDLVSELKQFSKTSISLQLCLNRIAVIRSETQDNVSISFLHKKEA